MYFDEFELVPKVARIVGLNKLVDRACRVCQLPSKGIIDRLILEETVCGSIGHGNGNPANGQARHNEAQNAHRLHCNILNGNERNGLVNQKSMNEC